MSMIFISYAKEDREMAIRIWEDLKSAGLQPWIDSEEIAPGENWSIAIKDAIRRASRFIILLSEKSVTKRGFVQAEIAVALDQVSLLPPRTVFIIPLRLDNVTPRHEELRDLQWLDLFPSYDAALQRLINRLRDDSISTAAFGDDAEDVNLEITSNLTGFDSSRQGVQGRTQEPGSAAISGDLPIEITMARHSGVVLKVHNLAMGRIALSIKLAGEIKNVSFRYTGMGIDRGDYVEFLFANGPSSSESLPVFMLNRSTGESRELVKPAVVLCKFGAYDRTFTLIMALIPLAIGFTVTMGVVTYLTNVKHLPPDAVSATIFIVPPLVSILLAAHLVSMRRRELAKMSDELEGLMLESVSSFWA